MDSSDILDKLQMVMDREAPIDPIEAIHFLMAAAPRKTKGVGLPEIAFGFDANAFLQIPKSKRFADITDYFSSKHSAPIVVPGQVVQEFWNNQYVALHNTGSSIKGKLDQLEGEMAKVDTRFGEFSVEIKRLLESMSEEFGYLRDPSVMGRISTFCELMLAKASCMYVPRTRFHGMAAQRKRTRTPPGFKDDGDGDFFVWLDFLYSLAFCKKSGYDFDHCVLITDDKKIDWSLGGMAHPILVAEAAAMLGVNFEVWNMASLEKAVADYLAETS